MAVERANKAMLAARVVAVTATVIGVAETVEEREEAESVSSPL